MMYLLLFFVVGLAVVVFQLLPRKVKEVEPVVVKVKPVPTKKVVECEKEHKLGARRLTIVYLEGSEVKTEVLSVEDKLIKGKRYVRLVDEEVLMLYYDVDHPHQLNDTTLFLDGLAVYAPVSYTSNAGFDGLNMQNVSSGHGIDLTYEGRRICIEGSKVVRCDIETIENVRVEKGLDYRLEKV